jgi:hypothetical protein
MQPTPDRRMDDRQPSPRPCLPAPTRNTVNTATTQPAPSPALSTHVVGHGLISAAALHPRTAISRLSTRRTPPNPSATKYLTGPAPSCLTCIVDAGQAHLTEIGVAPQVRRFDVDARRDTQTPSPASIETPSQTGPPPARCAQAVHTPTRRTRIEGVAGHPARSSAVQFAGLSTPARNSHCHTSMCIQEGVCLMSIGKRLSPIRAACDGGPSS